MAPRSPARLGLRLSIGLLSFLILVASGVAWASFKNFKADLPHGPAVPGLAAGASDPDGADQNILLVGSDSRAGASPQELRDLLSTGDDGGTVNTDTIMLLHVPADGGRPTLVSFPRDSWVDIPGYGKNKINAAYPLAYTDAKNAHRSEVAAEGAGLVSTIRTITALTGLHVDHYAQIDLLGFYRISIAIGGVPVCLVHAQNAQTDSDAFGSGYSGIDLPAGVSVISGKQALAFVRQRHGLPHGDLDRIRRQQYFLSAAFHKVASAGVVLNPFKLRDLMRAVGRSLLTDPSLDPLALARQFETMSSGGIRSVTIPNNGPQLIYPDGVETSIVAVDRAAIPAFVRQLSGRAADSALARAKAADPASVTVDVLNGNGTVGLAGRNADALKARGFKVGTVDSTDPAARTEIRYPAGQEAQAKALAAAVPKAALVETGTVSRTTLVLGQDGLQVAGPGTAGASGSSGAPAASGSSPKAAPGAGSTPGRRSTAAPAQPAPGLGCID